MRGVIRANVSATRKAYINAETANPDTPMTEVKIKLAADTWEAITELRDIFNQKGWFDAPPKGSHLLRLLVVVGG